MLKKIRKIITYLEESHLTFPLWIGTFSAIILSRLLVEAWLAKMPAKSFLFLFYEFSHTFLFFLVAYLLFSWSLKLFLKVEFRQALNVMLWGYLLILTPPLWDHLISWGKGFWSFYKFDGIIGLGKRFLTFFGDRPDIGITYGVRIEVALALLFIFIYSLTRVKLNRALMVVLFSYLIFFILGTFPSYITLAIHGFQEGFLKVSEVDVAGDFLSPARFFSREVSDIVSSLNIKMSLIYALFLSGMLIAGFFGFCKKQFLAWMGNARFPQMGYHLGLLIVGTGISLIFENKDWLPNFFNVSAFLLTAEAVILAWFASVVINDIFDQKIDFQTNPRRPLPEKIFSPKNYQVLGWAFFTASLFFSAIVNFKIALFLLAYQALAFLYSVPPLRLKRFPLIATFTSAIASLLIVFSGFALVSPSQDFANFPPSIIWLLIIVYTLALPIKDFKDIEGDRSDGVYTLPVIFGEQWGKIFVASGIFSSFLLSIILLNEFRLFWWALLFGGLAFWTVISMRGDGKITYRNIFWWILGIIFLYGLILVKIVFI